MALHVAGWVVVRKTDSGKVEKISRVFASKKAAEDFCMLAQKSSADPSCIYLKTEYTLN